MTICIVCVDDQREVLSTLRNDLSALPFLIESCESAREAQEVMDDLDAQGHHVALIVCDQVMPEKSGVDFLTEVQSDDRFAHTRKLLLTGLASHQDAIQAINQANISAYIEKPWDPAELIGTVRRLVTEYVIAAGMDYMPMMDQLDQETLYKALRNRV